MTSQRPMPYASGMPPNMSFLGECSSGHKHNQSCLNGADFVRS